MQKKNWHFLTKFSEFIFPYLRDNISRTVSAKWLNSRVKTISTLIYIFVKSNFFSPIVRFQEKRGSKRQFRILKKFKFLQIEEKFQNSGNFSKNGKNWPKIQKNIQIFQNFKFLKIEENGQNSCYFSKNGKFLKNWRKM